MINIQRTIITGEVNSAALMQEFKTRCEMRRLSRALEEQNKLLKNAETRPAKQNTDPAVHLIADKIMKCIHWIESEDILKAEIELYHRRGMLSIQDDILITDYDFILGIIDFWESKGFIPVIKNGRNERIKNNFKWKDTTGVIRDFKDDTLNSHRKSKHYYFMFEKVHG